MKRVMADERGSRLVWNLKFCCCAKLVVDERIVGYSPVFVAMIELHSEVVRLGPVGVKFYGDGLSIDSCDRQHRLLLTNHPQTFDPAGGCILRKNRSPNTEQHHDKFESHFDTL